MLNDSMAHAWSTVPVQSRTLGEPGAREPDVEFLARLGVGEAASPETPTTVEWRA